MVRGALEELKGYFEKSELQRKLTWYKIAEELAYETEHTNSLPLAERFSANAKLLAEASKHYPYGKDGPRGPRPILASSRNIVLISGARNENKARNWGKFIKDQFDGISKLLLNLDLTASNPYDWDFQFSDEDVRRGVYIPKQIDEWVARALGILYADGRVDKNQRYIVLGGRYDDFKFYQTAVPEAFDQAFNLLQAQPYEANGYEPGPLSKRDFPLDVLLSKNPLSKNPRIMFSSTALYNWLREHIEFPIGKQEKQNKGISPKIRQLDKTRKIEFLKYFLGSSVYINKGKTQSYVSNVSRQLLEDIRNLLIEIGVEKAQVSTSVVSDPIMNSYQLRIFRVPTKNMWELALFDANPVIREIAGVHIGPLTERWENFRWDE